MQVPIEQVKILKRVRVEMGDLQPLMNSLKKYGQLNPIIIDQKYNLIAGHRRLESARRLGWTTIEAFVSEDATEIDKLEIELEENMQRKNLTSDEIAGGFNRLNKLMNPNIFQRIVNFFRRFFARIFKRKKGK